MAQVLEFREVNEAIQYLKPLNNEEFEATVEKIKKKRPEWFGPPIGPKGTGHDGWVWFLSLERRRRK